MVAWHALPFSLTRDWILGLDSEDVGIVLLDLLQHIDCVGHPKWQQSAALMGITALPIWDQIGLSGAVTER